MPDANRVVDLTKRLVELESEKTQIQKELTTLLNDQTPKEHTEGTKQLLVEKWEVDHAV